MSEPVVIIGIDLAWGEKNPDGVTILTYDNGIERPATSMTTGLTRGDEDLLGVVNRAAVHPAVMIAVDAPLLCINETGSRPVDKLCSALFRVQEAGCYPVNRGLCRRPFRIADALRESGYALTTALDRSPRFASEVYPHPATIRLFGLEKTIKYKKGRVAGKRSEFARYQDCLKRFLAEEIPELAVSADHELLFSEPWRKPLEDQIDSILCASIAHRHLRYSGTRSEVLGDDETGHMLIPLL
jgi:predicted RNase H-like nuclease